MVTEQQKLFLQKGIAQLKVHPRLTQRLILGGFVGPCALLLWQRFSDIPIYEYLGIEYTEYLPVCEEFDKNGIVYKHIKELDNDVIEAAEESFVHGIIDQITDGAVRYLLIEYHINTVDDYLNFRVLNEDGYKELKRKNSLEVFKLDSFLNQFGQTKERTAWRSVVCITE